MSDSLPPHEITRQAPLSMGFSRQEYWSRQPFPLPGDLPDPGIKSRSPALQADFLPTKLPGKPREATNSTLIRSISWILILNYLIRSKKPEDGAVAYQGWGRGSGLLLV